MAEVMVKRAVTNLNLRELEAKLAEACNASRSEYAYRRTGDILFGGLLAFMEAKVRVSDGGFWTGPIEKTVLSMPDYETTRRLFKGEVVPHVKVQHDKVDAIKPVVDAFSAEYGCLVFVQDVDTVDSRDW
jgi:hypothetical protein